MSARFYSRGKWMPLALLLLFLAGRPLAMSAPLQNPAAYFSRNAIRELIRLQTLGLTPGMPGESPVFADFDGDQRADIAVAKPDKDRYKIIVLLSTRLETAVLSPSVPLAGFRLHACDINHDSYPDVVAVGSNALHPLAVWLGDGRGNFEITDPNLFRIDAAFAEPSRKQDNRISQDQDLSIESPDPACAKTTTLSENPALERKGFITCRRSSFTLRKAHAAIAPRSPPINDPTQTRL